MEEILKFLSELAKNNNRPWFNAHKDWYLACKKTFDGMVEELIARISDFDPSISNLKPADCTYRIYRDIRFRADKSPYKTHFGAYIVPGGKKSGFSGYYLHIDPSNQSFLATGDYITEARVLKILREDISYEEGAEFLETLKVAEGFYVDFSNALKKVPKGFEADKPYSEYLRLRCFCLIKDIDRNYLLSPNLIDRAAEDFANTKPFLDFVNRAIAYNED